MTRPRSDFFIVLFGVFGGLPLSQVVFFVVVQSLERTRNGRIFIVLQEAEEGGVTVLRRSVEFIVRER